MNEKFLPIGTICTLKGINKKIMISGFFGTSYVGKIKMYDYIGVEYPEGMLSQKTYTFNHSDIVEVNFMGYLEEEHKILNSNLLNNNVSDEPIKESNLLSNFKFDENGVVIFDGSVPLDDTKQEPENKTISNPFNQIYQKQETKETPKQGFSQFKFDENGVVIAEEQVSTGGFKFDENGVVIADNTVAETNNSQFKFDENGVVISDGNDTIESSISSPQFKFDENGVVISDGNDTIQNNIEPQFQFDKNGMVVQDGNENYYDNPVVIE